MGTFYVPVGLATNYYLPYVYDPLSIRIGIAFFCLLFFVFTFTSTLLKKYHYHLVELTLTITVIQFTYLLYVNENHWIFSGCLGVIWVVTACFFKDKWLYLLFVICNFLSLAFMITFVSSNVNLIAFFLLLLVFVTSSILTRIYFQATLQKLYFFHQLLKKSEALIVVADVSGNVKYVSDNSERLIGFSSDELCGKAWWDAQENKIASRQEIKEKIDKIKARVSQKIVYEQKFRKKDGIYCKIKWNDSLLENGDLLGVGTILEPEITPDSNVIKLSNLTRNSNNISFIVNKQFALSWCNELFLKTFGVEETDALQQSIQTFFADILKGETLQEIIEKCKYQTSNVPLSFEIDGHKIIHTQFLLIPILDEGEWQQTICIGKDVSAELIESQNHKNSKQQNEMLSNLNQKILFAEKMDDILSFIVAFMQKLPRTVHRISIASYNFDTERVHVLYSNNGITGDISIDSFSYPLQESLSTINMMKGAEYALNNLNELNPSEFTPTQAKLFNEHGVGCYLTFPIRFENELIGSMNFAAKDDNQFTDDFVDLLKLLSKNVSIAVKQFNLKETIRLKNSHLEAKNKEVLDSLGYAKRIQKAFMPTNFFCNNCFHDSMVFLKPKDILSGDFYWIEEMGDESWIVCADCTGHGVSGALMSIVGANILKQAFSRKEINQPNQLLAFLNERLIETLQNSSNKISDGMDIAVCKLHFKENKLYFAGVMRPLMHCNNESLQIYLPSRTPIGAKFNQKASDFELHEINIAKGDKFYLSSDGFSDQFGGENNKKYGSKRFRELIRQTSSYPMSQQVRIISNSFDLWRREYEQTDDVLIVGFQPICRE
jgi:PAS domain S-box-containing protein